MDSLRPDLDDLNQYKSRQEGGKKLPKKTPSQKQEKVPTVAAAPAKSSLGMKFMLILLLALSAGLGYLVWLQQQSIQGLNDKVSEADNFISQSKLLIARLEGELTETGEELEQSGSDAQKKLAFLDSEMRKLWGVSNDRNKKSIKSNTEEIAALSKKLQSLTSKSTQNHKAALQRISELADQADTLDGRLATVSGEMSIIRAEQDEKISNMSSQLKVSSQELKSLQADLQRINVAQAEIKPLLDSINESRRQLVQRVINIEQRLKPQSSSGGDFNTAPANTTP